MTTPMDAHRPLMIHATAVALSVDGAWVGVLLRGPSGSGKSDLALRLIDAGARLVADDQTDLDVADGGPMVRAPARLPGVLEVRGVGPMRMPSLDTAPLALVVDLAAGADIERLPERRTTSLAGFTVPAIRLAPFEASAGAKVRLAVAAALSGELASCDRLAAS